MKIWVALRRSTTAMDNDRKFTRNGNDLDIPEAEK